MSFATLQHERPSFFGPLLFSLLLVHLPLIYLLFFMDWQTPLQRSDVVKPVLQVPVMLNLKSLPLVDQAAPKTEEIPDQASAIGEHNVKAEVETVAAGDSQKSNAVSSPQTVQNTEPKNLKDVLAKLDDKQKTDEAKMDSLFQNSKADDANFKSSMEPSGDHLPFYKFGGKTYINALAYPHVAYFVEMKRKFRTAWNPRPILRANWGKLPPHAIQTVWGYTIDRSGKIIDIDLIQSSPIVDYDQEAKRTIVVSAPFSPPPAELLKGESTLYVSFAFMMYY